MPVRLDSLDEAIGEDASLKSYTTNSPCKIEDCDILVGPKGARGMCTKHYYIWKRDGGLVGMVRPSDMDRLLAKVEKTESCWNWIGAMKANGYGAFWFNQSPGYAHRAAWEMANGPIPEGMLIDHLCFNHACVNASHMRLTTQKQNQENRAGQRSDNTSGYRGVSWKRGRWTAEFHHHGRSVYVGRFDDVEEANRAVIAARNEIFTHNELDRITKKAA